MPVTMPYESSSHLPGQEGLASERWSDDLLLIFEVCGCI